MGIRLRRDTRGEKFVFMDGFKTGLGISLVAGVFLIGVFYLYLGVIDTGYLHRANDWSIYVKVLGGQDLALVKAESVKNAWMSNMHVRAIGQLPLAVFMGAVISAVVSLILVRKK